MFAGLKSLSQMSRWTLAENDIHYDKSTCPQKQKLIIVSNPLEASLAGQQEQSLSISLNSLRPQVEGTGGWGSCRRGPHKCVDIPAERCAEQHASNINRRQPAESQLSVATCPSQHEIVLDICHSTPKTPFAIKEPLCTPCAHTLSRPNKVHCAHLFRYTVGQCSLPEKPRNQLSNLPLHAEHSIHGLLPGRRRSQHLCIPMLSIWKPQYSNGHGFGPGPYAQALDLRPHLQSNEPR